MLAWDLLILEKINLWNFTLNACSQITSLYIFGSLCKSLHICIYLPSTKFVSPLICVAPLNCACISYQLCVSPLSCACIPYQLCVSPLSTVCISPQLCVCLPSTVCISPQMCLSPQLCFSLLWLACTVVTPWLRKSTTVDAWANAFMTSWSFFRLWRT